MSTGWKRTQDQEPVVEETATVEETAKPRRGRPRTEDRPTGTPEKTLMSLPRGVKSISFPEVGLVLTADPGLVHGARRLCRVPVEFVDLARSQGCEVVKV